MKLFEIVAQFKGLEALDVSDDIPDEVVRDTLEGLEGDFQEKAINIAKFILSLDATAESIAEAADAMKLRALRIEKRSAALRNYLLFNLQVLDKKRIETSEIVIRRQMNPPSVYVAHESAVPEEFWRTPPPPPKVIDKKALKAALESGRIIDGCFVESGEHVRISL